MIPQPSPAPGEHSKGRQDRRRSELRCKLADDEKRLRELVASYELDSETIEYESLESVKEVIKRIYPFLVKDAHNGVLAEKADVWESLKDGYQQVLATTSKLRPILKRSKDIELEPRPAPAELDEATGRMVDRRQEWLTKVAEFRDVFSAFYDELALGEEKPA